MTSFLIKRHGRLTFPIDTDDLLKFIEPYTSDLDSYADLSNEGDKVHGVTIFSPGKKPVVRIEADLWKDRTEHRLRTTLTHEGAHAYLHTPLFNTNRARSSRDASGACCVTQKCHTDSILNASKPDWLEWQAGFMSAAFLMPATKVRELAQAIVRQANLDNSEINRCDLADTLITVIKDTFQVSKEAASIRLVQLEILLRSQHGRHVVLI